ncbi:DUF1232 domain-containing protein [Rhizobium sp. CFBP 8762]|uniref:YkvA family protein n=1 Tax=Rhizobium sp. CFBP 8762 TaxID=2775279 RepID=UPI001785AAB2|nr:YkvA family protein [Rhizobium sp. CFBP 8762]MBD8554509.1 DUF1232 domain-containing protein [Rhizobium sp. CFBP 8762]
MLKTLKRWAKTIKRDVIALWLAARDQRTSLAAKLVAGAVAAYALSPIDLIPDFIPALGLVDDMILVPLGILLAVRLIPAALIEELRRVATERGERPVSRVAMVVIVAIWLLAAAFAVLMYYR